MKKEDSQTICVKVALEFLFGMFLNPSEPETQLLSFFRLKLCSTFACNAIEWLLAIELKVNANNNNNNNDNVNTNTLVKKRRKLITNHFSRFF